jgi:pimeloyl-ACP methyl ester carboxylesterase
MTSRTGRSPAYVLVHGAWHGAWAFAATARRLTARGRLAIALELPGHGLDLTPQAEVTLDRYADKICAALDRLAPPVTLVAHSMGGVPATVAAERRPDIVTSLVYVAAFVPADGQTLIELALADTEAEVYPNLVIAPDQSFSFFRRDAARPVFYGECTPEDAAWATLRLGPQPLAPYQQPVRTTPGRWGAIPRYYIRTARDRAVTPGLQDRFRDQHGFAAVRELDTDHSPFLSQPDAFLEAVLGFESGLQRFADGR